MDYVSILRQYKIGPFAIFDTILAYVGMFLLAPVLSKLCAKMHLIIPRAAWLWFTMPISVIFHFLFRQNTPLMNMLFSQHSFIIPAIILMGMVFMGLITIKKEVRQP